MNRKFYGAIGQYTFVFFNLFTAASITSQGRSCISNAGLFFEAFLANNVKFSSLENVLAFINNVLEDCRYIKFNDRIVLDRNITVEECFYWVMENCGFNYIPSDEDCDIVWRLINNLTQTEINRLFYKNNLFGFCSNNYIKNIIINILKRLDLPYLDPRDKKCPKDIYDELEYFKSLLAEYVYYPHIYIDKMDRYANMIRKASLITDTDSTIVSLDPWYNFVLEFVKDMDLKISHTLVNPIVDYPVDEDGDLVEYVQVIDTYDGELDYDFYNQEVIEQTRMCFPTNIIPQDGVRHSIINILAYCLGDLVNRYMVLYTKNSNSYNEDKDCLLYMKNEFLFKTMMIKEGKKNYASIQELQEGHFFPDGKLDIKGLPMSKSGVNPKAQKELKKILYEDILNAENIDQVKILKDLAIMEDGIYKTLRNGGKEYYKPVKIKSYSAYDDPMRIQGVKAACIWNDLATENLPIFDLNERNQMDIAKVTIDYKTVEKIKDTFPEMYEKILQVLNKEYTKGCINAIAIPKDLDTIPEWVLDFIDYKTIISDNCSNLPIECVGIYRGHDSNNFTNIINM